MKKLLQCVSILAMGLLIAPASLAALLCASVGQSMACPMAASEMGPDCPMAGAASASNCPENCCSQPSLLKVLAWAHPVRPKLRNLPTAIMPPAIAAAKPVQALARPINPSASSPPRFILFQVFRI